MKLNQRTFSLSDFSVSTTAWYVTMLVVSEIPWSKIWHLSFAEKTLKDISILTETDINHDQIHHKRNNLLGLIFFSPEDSHTKELLVLLDLGLGGITEFDANPKERFASFKVTLSNDRVLWVYGPSGYSNREQLARGRFFEGIQNHMEK